MCLISIADIVCITSHPGSESCTASVLDVHCWHCLNELPSSEWVMCSSCAWFPIADIAFMNSHPGSELCAAPVLDFYYWHCLHKISSSLWVMCNFCALFPLLTLPVWTLIQFVSHVQLLCFISIVDIACINSHSVCESCAALVLYFHCWCCLHELSSSLWVMCKLMCFISIADIACINSYPVCESCAAHVLDFYCWHYMHELPSSKWAMCSSYAWFPLLTLPAQTLIQGVSHVSFCVQQVSHRQLMDFFSIANIACIKFHLASESCAPPVPCFHCLHKLPSRKWVMCTFCALFPLLTLLAWTLIQALLTLPT